MGLQPVSPEQLTGQPLIHQHVIVNAWPIEKAVVRLTSGFVSAQFPGMVREVTSWTAYQAGVRRPPWTDWP